MDALENALHGSLGEAFDAASELIGSSGGRVMVTESGKAATLAKRLQRVLHKRGLPLVSFIQSRPITATLE